MSRIAQGSIKNIEMQMLHWGQGGKAENGSASGRFM